MKEPIAHQSLAVRDLTEARDFYVEVLGCPQGRRDEATVDIWLFGTQVTLHDAPDEVEAATDRFARHFGVTLERADFDAVMARLDQHSTIWLRPRRTEYGGTVREQTKAMIADPSGNAIEFKTYPDPVNALEIPQDPQGVTPCA